MFVHNKGHLEDASAVAPSGSCFGENPRTLSGKTPVRESLGEIVGKICEGNPWLPGTVQVSVALPGGVTVARGVQFFPVGLLLEKGSFTRWVGCRSGGYPTEKPRADRRAVRVVRRMLITTDHLDLLSLVIIVSFCCNNVGRFVPVMSGGCPDSGAVSRQRLSYLTFAGLVNLLTRLF